MKLLVAVLFISGLCGALGMQVPRDSRCPAHTTERVQCPGHARTCSLARLDGCNRDGMYCCEDKCNDAVCYDRYGTPIVIDSYRNDFVPNTQFSRDFFRPNYRDNNRSPDSPLRDPSMNDRSRFSTNLVDNAFNPDENFGLRDGIKRSSDTVGGGYD